MLSNHISQNNHYEITTVQCDLIYSVTYAIVCVDPKQYLNIAQQDNFYLATHTLHFKGHTTTVCLRHI